MKLNLIGTAILVLVSLADAARAAEIAERKTLTWMVPNAPLQPPLLRPTRTTRAVSSPWWMTAGT